MNVHTPSIPVQCNPVATINGRNRLVTFFRTPLPIFSEETSFLFLKYTSSTQKTKSTSKKTVNIIKTDPSIQNRSRIQTKENQANISVK